MCLGRMKKAQRSVGTRNLNLEEPRHEAPKREALKEPKIAEQSLLARGA